MITVFKIAVDQSAPTLSMEPATADVCGLFDGRGKADLFFERPLRASLDDHPARSRQFCALAPGVLVVPELAWVDADEMYYCCSLGSELLAIETPHGYFVGVNPLEILPRAKEGDAPCLVDQFYAPVFRILGREPTDLFCVEGLGADDFKRIYDESGFRGLVFEEIWRGEGG